MTTTEDGYAFSQEKKGDPRVTRIGQVCAEPMPTNCLLNILIGEMSIVGLRPHAVALNRCSNSISLRFSRTITPSLASPAGPRSTVIADRPAPSKRCKFEWDLEHIENWSFLLDIKIIIMTFFS